MTPRNGDATAVATGPAWRRDLSDGAAVGVVYALVESACEDLGGAVLGGHSPSLPLAAVALVTWAALGAAFAGAARALRPHVAAGSGAAVALVGFLGLHTVLVAARLEARPAEVFALASSLAALGVALSPTLGPAPGWLRAFARPAPSFTLAVVAPWLLVAVSGRSRWLAAGLALVAAPALARGMARVEARRSLRLATLALLAVAIPGLGAIATREAPTTAAPIGAPPARALPHVILISLDTVRADHLSTEGYARPTSPQLSAFGERATRFTRHDSASDMTLPSHGSMFTGLYPRAHGAHFLPTRAENAAPLAAGVTTIAERLAAAGYVTAGFISNHAYLSTGFALSRGFQHWDDRRASAWVRSDSHLLLRAWLVAGLRPLLPLRASEAEFRDAREMTDLALRHVAEREHAWGGRPCFLFVNYMDAHWPYLPPARFRAVAPDYRETLRTSDYHQLDREVSTLQREIRPEERDELIARYDASIAYEDDELGRLLAGLGRTLDLDAALVIVTSDHGESFGERGLIGHSDSVHQEQIRTPLLIHFPGQHEGAVDMRLASGVDLLPTILEVVGLSPQPGVHGVSLLSPPVERRIFAESYADPFRSAWHPRLARMEWAVIAGREKLIASTAGASRLYDAIRDPAESTDRAQSEPGHVRALESALAAWRREVAATHGDSVPLDPELESRLKSLGYVR